MLQVYWLPPDTEEKLSLSMNVLLAFSMILFVVNDLTPDSSDSTPIVGKLLYKSCLIICIILTCNANAFDICAVNDYLLTYLLTYLLASP